MKNYLSVKDLISELQKFDENKLIYFVDNSQDFPEGNILNSSTKFWEHENNVYFEYVLKM